MSATDVPQSCADTIAAFDADWRKCATKKSSEAHCSCISSLDFSKVDSCKKTINSAFKASNNERKECVNSVGTCKKNSLEVAGILDNCKLLTSTEAAPETTAAPATTEAATG